MNTLVDLENIFKSLHTKESVKQKKYSRQNGNNARQHEDSTQVARQNQSMAGKHCTTDHKHEHQPHSFEFTCNK